MEYMILIHGAENFDGPAPGTPEFDADMAEWMTYTQRLIDGGHWIAGASLQPSTTATTIHKNLGSAPALTDGPFAETKEQLGGFYVISATDLDQALELASALPTTVGAIEVRPVMYRPDAE